MTARRTLLFATLLVAFAACTLFLAREYANDVLTGRFHGVVPTVWVLGVLAVGAFLATELILSIIRPHAATKARARVLVGSAVVSVMVAELVLRFAVDAFPTWQEQNGGFYFSAFGQTQPEWLFVSGPFETTTLEKPEFTFEMRMNGEGLRDIEHPKLKPPGEYRIVVLGDSFTEGIGATLEESWPRRLEDGLSSRFPNRSLRVMNAGVSGSDPWFEYVLLEKRLLAYEPDLVIIAMNSSDVFDVMTRGGRERFQSDGTVKFPDGPGWELLYASSRLVRLVVHGALGYNEDLIRRRDWDERSRSANDDLFECVAAFRVLSRAHDFRLLVVLHPHAGEVLSGRIELTPLLARLGRESDVDVVDLLDYFIEETNQIEEKVWSYYWELDRHHNAAGYAMLARGVEDALVETGVLE